MPCYLELQNSINNLWPNYGIVPYSVCRGIKKKWGRYLSVDREWFPGPIITEKNGIRVYIARHLLCEKRGSIRKYICANINTHLIMFAKINQKWVGLGDLQGGVGRNRRRSAAHIPFCTVWLSNATYSNNPVDEDGNKPPKLKAKRNKWTWLHFKWITKSHGREQRTHPSHFWTRYFGWLSSEEKWRTRKESWSLVTVRSEVSERTPQWRHQPSLLSVTWEPQTFGLGQSLRKVWSPANSIMWETLRNANSLGVIRN